jgi:hypothetical protein
MAARERKRQWAAWAAFAVSKPPAGECPASHRRTYVREKRNINPFVIPLLVTYSMS